MTSCFEIKIILLTLTFVHVCGLYIMINPYRIRNRHTAIYNLESGWLPSHQTILFWVYSIQLLSVGAKSDLQCYIPLYNQINHYLSISSTQHSIILYLFLASTFYFSYHLQILHCKAIQCFINGC